jgi:hypothetical protein
MTIEHDDLQRRLRVLLGLRGAVMTDEELSRMADCYPQCRGQENWGVRQYVRQGQGGGGREYWDVRHDVRLTGVGAREYRVVRGGSIHDVYRCAEWERATAVGAVLNELESEERSREAAGVE